MISGHPDHDEDARNIIHGIIGKATEAGELLEALQRTVIYGDKFDFPNVNEEQGDGFWYDAVLARATGTTFEEIQKTNIAKLRHRFPDNFTNYDANNRDLSGERQILEGGLIGPLPEILQEFLTFQNCRGTSGSFGTVEDKTSFEGLVVTLTGPSGCGKTVAAGKIAKILPNSKIVDAQV